MTKHENIAKALKARLSELLNRVVEIDSELRKPLSADLEEQATDLENQEALEAIEHSGIHEIHQIQAALKRISEGTYGICAHCGEDIDPKRLEALPTATVFRALRENSLPPPWTASQIFQRGNLAGTNTWIGIVPCGPSIAGARAGRLAQHNKDASRAVR
jgi:DnaK suppressor protein